MERRLFTVKLVDQSVMGATSLWPFVPADELPEPHPTAVTLRLPDGTRLTVRAVFGPVPRAPGSRAEYVCGVAGVKGQRIPPGTEVWV